jgi:hypothetical protein
MLLESLVLRDSKAARKFHPIAQIPKAPYRDIRAAIATINFFEARRATGTQATHRKSIHAISGARVRVSMASHRA